MAYQTIVAVFDTAAHAAAAVEALKAGGFAAADISMFDRDRLTGGRGGVNVREPGIAAVSSVARISTRRWCMARRSEGGVVVSVRWTARSGPRDGHPDLHRPADVHDRAITWRHRAGRPWETVAAAIAAGQSWPRSGSRCRISWPRGMKCCASPRSSWKSASAWSRPARPASAAS